MRKQVGRPVNVVQCDKPTLDQIHEVQKRYIEELFRCVLRSLRSFAFIYSDRFLSRSIWETHKDAFAANRKRELNIVD